MDLSTLTSLSRFKDIVVILIRYGFEDLVDRLDLPGKRPKTTLPAAEETTTYERLRLAIEALGPTFIKIGQIMSLRPDMLPPAMITELQKLQDDVAAVSFESVRPALEAELGKSLEAVFPVFETEILAAASLSQVYRAALGREGPAVAVKVQRPDIRPMVETDLKIMEFFADRIHHHFEELRLYDLPSLVRESRQTLLRELDFRREARYMKVARALMRDQAGIYVPEVHESLCTERLLVMEYVSGTKLRDVDISTMPAEAPRMAREGLRAGIKQIFEDGFFHADPHPGNILVTEDHRLCLIDWGMVGRLTVSDRYDLVDLIRALADRDSQRLTEVVLKVSVDMGDGVDRRGLERDLLDILDLYATVPIRDLNLGRLLLDVTFSMRAHGLGIRPDLATMIKALITLEGVARQLYPDLDVLAEAEPYIHDIVARRYSFESIWRNLSEHLAALFTARGRFPKRLSRIVEQLEHGDLQIRFEHRNLQELQQTLENTFNRLTFGIIIAALLIGSSMIITTGISPHLFGYPAFGIVGYLVSGVLGLWLVYNIIRNRKY